MRDDKDGFMATFRARLHDVSADYQTTADCEMEGFRLMLAFQRMESARILAITMFEKGEPPVEVITAIFNALQAEVRPPLP